MEKITSYLIPLENIPSIHFFHHIVEATVVAVGDDGLRLFFELLQIVDDERTEESSSILKRRLIDNDLRSLGLHALHHTLDGRLTEIVGVGFHRQAKHADGEVGFLALVIL